MELEQTAPFESIAYEKGSSRVLIFHTLFKTMGILGNPHPKLECLGLSPCSISSPSFLQLSTLQSSRCWLRLESKVARLLAVSGIW